MFPWENHWIVIHMEKIRGFENAGSGNAVMIFHIILWLFTSIPGAYYESLRCRPCGFLEIQSGMVPNATDNVGRNATVTNQPAAVRCPGQYCRCLHIGTASGNCCREFLASDGHRKMSARTSRDVPADCTKILPWDRAASGGLPSGNRPIPLRESHDGTHIVRSSAGRQRITVRCPACKSLHQTLSLCECFIKRFQMNISCKISDGGMTHITANPPQPLHRS